MRKSNRYRITVITVCRNAEYAIEKTIQSVLEQDYGDLEYIIVDGASTDHTMDIVKKYAESYPIKYISESDSGIYNAMNKGIRMSNGDYIIFENAGDVFCNQKVVSDTVQTMKGHAADIYYGNYVKTMRDRTIEVREDNGKLNKLLQGHRPCHQSVFSSSRLLKRFPFDETYKISADYDWLLKCKKLGAKFCYMDNAVCIFDGSGVSSQKRQQQTRLREDRRSVQKHFPVLCFFKNLWQ